jgi:hypothetical protein
MNIADYFAMKSSYTNGEGLIEDQLNKKSNLFSLQEPAGLVTDLQANCDSHLSLFLKSLLQLN